MRNTNFLRGAAIALVAVFSIGTAQAAAISGVLNFGGQVVPNDILADATGLTFPSGFFVTNATVDFASDGIVFATTGTINDFTFNPSSPVNPLLTVGSFSYALSSITVVDQSTDFLALSGVGTLSAAGFDDTPFMLSMSADTSGGNIAFSGTLAAVPIPGALILLMSGLAALGIRRRS